MVYLTGYGFPMHRGGPMHYASEVGLFNVVPAMNRFAQNPMDDASAWAARTAPGQAWSLKARPSSKQPLAPHYRIKELHMTSAVIVSTARTPLAKSWKGSFNMTHGATLGGHAVQHAVLRAGIDGADVDDVIMGCATPRGPRAATSRARSR